ncbi:MAG: M23 family metallopeptidase [Nannocystaceae bacterium]|nr:M23 family metallopeptidase [Nannocystaceae bacterium]
MSGELDMANARGRLRVVGALALSLVLACGDEEKAVEASAPDQAQADASHDPPSPTVDLGAVEIPWAPGVEILETGKAAKALAPAPTLGVSRPIVVVVEASATPKKRGRRWPRVTLTGTSTLTSASPDASRHALTLSTLALAPGKAFDEAATATIEAELPVSDTAIEFIADGAAATTTLGWPGAAKDPKAVEIGHAVAHALSHLTLPLPTEPVGRKGRIEIRRMVDLMGLSMQQTLTLDVDKVQGKQLELSGDVRYTLPPHAETGSALGIGEVISASAEGKFFLRLDTPTATPVEMNIVIDLVVRGADSEQKVWLDLRIDEDYLAMADRRVKLRGEFTQGGLVIGHVAPDTKVWFKRHKQRVSPAGDFVIGFARTAKDRALLSFQFPGAEIERHIVRVAAREFLPERIDGLPPEWVDLDRATRRALASSKKRVTKVRDKVSKEPYFAGGFRWPLRGRITSTYGRQRFLNGNDRGPHWGVDLAVPVGKPVKAPAAGVVVLAEPDVPLSGFLLIIDHGHGLTSSFLHLKRFKVSVGEVVKAGQVIALSGNSGRSTGPHLDWRMNLREIRVDPETIVEHR